LARLPQSYGKIRRKILGEGWTDAYVENIVECFIINLESSDDDEERESA
jgi:hypothetical protein